MKKIYKLRMPIEHEHITLFEPEIESILTDTVKRWETKILAFPDGKFMYDPSNTKYKLEITALCTRSEYDNLLSKIDQGLDVRVEVDQ